MTPKGIAGAIHHAYANQVAPTTVTCPHGPHEVDRDLMLVVCHPLSGLPIWRGCYDCLYDVHTAQPHSIDYVTRILLQRAFTALTTATGYMDEGEVASDIEKVLQKG